MTTRSPYSTSATRSSSSRSTRTAPTRCRCAESPATPLWPTRSRSPTRPCATFRRPTTTATRSSSTIPPGVRCSWPARSPASTRRRRPRTGWPAGSRRPGCARSRSAVDVTNYVMLELGQPIHGYDRAKLSGAIRVRRATEGEQLTTLDGVRRTLSAEDLLITDDSGPIGLAGTMGGETTELSADHDRPRDRGGSFRCGVDLPDREAPQAAVRGIQALRTRRRPELPAAAADRVVELLAELGGGTVGSGVTVVGDPPPRRSIRIGYDLPARITGMDIDAETTVGAPAGGRLRRRRGLGRPDRDRAAVAPGSDRSLRPGRRGGQGRGLRQGAVGASAGPGRPRPHAGAEAPSPRRAGAGRRGLHRGDQLPVRRRRRLGPARTRRRRRAPPDPADGQPAQRRGAAADHDAAPGHPAGRWAATSDGPTPTSPCSSTAWCSCRPATRRRPLLGVDRRPSEDEWAAIEKAVPHQPMHLAIALTGHRELEGWWGAGREASWADAIAAVREAAAALGLDLDVTAASVAPWHPGRCAELRIGDIPIGHAGELHPKVCAAYGLPAAFGGRGGRPRRPPPACGPDRPRAEVLVVPGREGGRRARRRHVDASGRGGEGAQGRRRRNTRVDPAVRHLHRRPD